MSILFFILALVGLWLAHNAWRPLPPPGRHGALWFPALVVGEAAPFGIVLRMGIAAVAIWLGFAGGWAGRSGLVAIGLAVLLLAVVQVRAIRSRSTLEAAVEEHVGRAVRLPRLGLRWLGRPLPGIPSSVVVDRDLVYGPGDAHRADRYRRRDLDGPAPVLIQVHGGGWTGGRRGRQARPLMYRMADAGWIVFDVGYRLSPKATFPDHLIDVKRTVAWIRETAADHGADPGCIIITGGSAGGQLAALVALTAGDRSLQPGFEHGDTSVDGCLPVYGLHDLTDRTGTRPKWPYLASHVLKATPAEDPDLWRLASATRSARSDRPPFFVVHGERDSLVRPGESRRLVAALRAAGGPPVGHAELLGATHGFDALSSVRGLHFAAAAQIVLEHWRAATRAGTLGEQAADG